MAVESQNIPERSKNFDNLNEANIEIFEQWKKTIEIQLYLNQQIQKLTDIEKNNPNIPKNKVSTILDSLINDYNDYNGALEVIKIIEESEPYYQLKVKNTVVNRGEVQNFTHESEFKPLTLKVLAYVAYNQPIEKEDIIEVFNKTSIKRISKLIKKGFIKQKTIQYDIVDEQGDYKKHKTKEFTTSKYFAEYFGIIDDPDIVRQEMEKYI